MRSKQYWEGRAKRKRWQEGHHCLVKTTAGRLLTTFIVIVFSFKDLKAIPCVIGIRGSFVLMKCGKGGPERLSNVFEVTQVWIPGPTGTQGRDVGEQGCEPSSPPRGTETNEEDGEGAEGAGNPERGRGKHSFPIWTSVDISRGGFFRGASRFGPLMPVGRSPCPTRPSAFSSLGLWLAVRAGPCLVPRLPPQTPSAHLDDGV